MNWSSVFFINGILISSLAGVMCVPIVGDLLFFKNFNAGFFLAPMLFTCFLGGLLVLANKQKGPRKLETTDAFLLTSLAWILVPIFSGLPFYFCNSIEVSFIDAWFEAVSCLTVTGSTILKNAIEVPGWLIFWKFILCYIGGAGMILMGMIILPILRIGGMHLFRSESSEKSEKILPSVAQMASRTTMVYTAAIILCFLLLIFSGMTTKDAICYAISAISTCGFTSQYNSLAELNNIYIELTLVLAMIFGGSSFLLYIRMWKDGLKVFCRDDQFKGYIKAIISFSFLASFLYWNKEGYGLGQGLRHGLFNTVSILTTTGFFNENFLCASNFSMILFFLIGFVGGCTGSTAGGIKIFRFQILFLTIKTHILNLRRPHAVLVPTYNGQKVTDSVVNSVCVFFALYFLTIASATIGFMLCDFNFSYATSVAVFAVGNIGSGFIGAISPHISVSDLTTMPKILIIACMILGRLELLSLLTILTPSFWKK